MLNHKHTDLSNLPTKRKSPYKLQFEDFERRLEKCNIKTKLPTLSSKSKGIALPSAEYLGLAKRLMNNQ
jgi:hypothetical protein